MLPRALTFLSLIGLLLSAGAWSASNRTVNLPQPSVARAFHIPSWLVVLVGVLCVAGFVGMVVLIVKIDKRNLPHHRQRLGLCKQCGYDLRGSKERCPECGAAIDAPTAKAEW